MERTLVFLKEASMFYLSTANEESPILCPCNIAFEYEGRLYLLPSKSQRFYDAIRKNSQIEISCITNGQWLRISGEIKSDNRCEVKDALLKMNPNLEKILQENTSFKILYFTKGTASFCSVDSDPIIEHLA